MPGLVPIQSTIDNVAEELSKATGPSYLRFEIGNKRSLLKVDPETKTILYIDQNSRPLLPFEQEKILKQLPTGFRIVDISRLESDRTSERLGGFHAHQPIFHGDEWLGYATQKILDTERTLSKQVTPTLLTERFQTQARAPLSQFFANPSKQPEVTITKTNKENVDPDNRQDVKSNSRKVR